MTQARRSVLIVDDSPDGREMLAECLTFRGFEVIEAVNG
jgi:CheY-like chemotaxis protein